VGVNSCWIDVGRVLLWGVVSEHEIRCAHWRAVGLFWMFIVASALPLGLGLLVLFLVDRFAPEERFWLGVGLLIAAPLLLSSLAANALGLIVLVKHFLHFFGVEIFSGIERGERVKHA
jgi:hypothetical protein